jgi:signal transduction histidine kinase
MSGLIFASWSIRRKLLFFLLIVFLPLACSIIFAGIRERHDEIAKAQNRAMLVAQGLQAKQEQVAITTRTLLSTLARLPAVQALDESACDKLFRQLHDQYPFYSVIVAATPGGKAFAASVPLASPSNLSGRPYFTEAIRSDDFSVGEYMVGRATHLKSLNFGFPVYDGRKRLVAVLMAGFNLEEYSRFVSKANLPEGYAVVIVDRNGTRLFRAPDSDAFGPGTVLPTGSLRLVSREGPDQGYYELTGQDGVSRAYAFSRLRLREGDPPYLYMIVGMPKGRILHEATLRMVQNLSILVIAALMALTFAWLFLRHALLAPLDRLVEAVQRFGKGEMVARTGLPHTTDELGRLARSFDDMASMAEKDVSERRMLQREVMSISAAEQARIGQDLHDSLGQLLTGIALKSKSLANFLERNSLPATEDATKVADLANQAVVQARNLARNLLSADIDHGGICAWLEDFSLRVRHLYDVSCTFDYVPEHIEMDRVVAHEFYRIAHEAFMNAIKHGKASSVSISLHRTDHLTTLRIEDNGVGFSSAERTNGIGLRLMNYRAQSIGASLDIHDAGQGGTVVECVLGDE